MSSICLSYALAGYWQGGWFVNYSTSACTDCYKCTRNRWHCYHYDRLTKHFWRLVWLRAFCYCCLFSCLPLPLFIYQLCLKKRLEMFSLQFISSRDRSVHSMNMEKQFIHVKQTWIFVLVQSLNYVVQSHIFGLWKWSNLQQWYEAIYKSLCIKILRKMS